MKILQINKFYYRRRGAETYLLDLIDLLEKQGHEVAVFAMEHPENLPSQYSQYFVENVDLSGRDALQRVSMMGKMRMAKNVIWNTAAQRKLEELLKIFKPDVAHIHNIYHQISPSILETLKRHNIPIVQTLHDYKLICPNYELFTQGSPCERCKGHNYYNAVKYKCLKNSRAMSALAMTEMYLHKFKQVYEKNVDCFISPSQFLKSKIIDWKENVKRIEVLPNFIDTPPNPTPQTLHPDLNPQPYLLYAGALSDIKGVRLLLDNFQNNHYNCTLHLAGAGPLAEQVEAAAKSNKNIVYLGRLSKEALYQQITGAAAVLVPSIYYDNFPYSVLEAFAQGKPVIGSNLGGIPELVQPNKTGWLFDPTKTETLTQAIQQALSNETLLNTYGNNARQLVATLSPQLHYDRLLEIYQSVIN